MEDIKIKRDILALIGQEPVGKMEELFDWLKENRNHEDYMIRCDCVNVPIQIIRPFTIG